MDHPMFQPGNWQRRRKLQSDATAAKQYEAILTLGGATSSSCFDSQSKALTMATQHSVPAVELSAPEAVDELVHVTVKDPKPFTQEEVWEVAARIIGLVVGVSLLAADAFAASYPLLAFSWAVLRVTHLWLRYKSLEVLVFPTINYKRASCLLQSFIQGSEVPDCILCNRLEPILLPSQFMFPRVLFGCSLKDTIGPHMLSPELESLLKLYKHETYVLVLHPNRLHGFEARILFKDGATSLTMLRSLYQANLLLHWMDAKFYEDNSKLDEKYRLKNSLYEMQLRFTGFLKELERVGWDLEKIVIKVPVQRPVYVFSEDTDL